MSEWFNSVAQPPPAGIDERASTALSSIPATTPEEWMKCPLRAFHPSQPRAAVPHLSIAARLKLVY